MKTSPERNLNEADIVRKALAGEQAAWVELVRLHQEALFRLAYLHLGDAAEAEDAAQEALIRAHKSLRRFDTERPLRPWLLSIVANVCRNRKRSLGRYWNALQAWGRQRREESANINVPEENEDMHAAIHRLDEDDQNVIYLRYFLDMSVAESAQTLGIPEGTVKSRSSRAMERLKGVIQRDFPELEQGLR